MSPNERQDCKRQFEQFIKPRLLFAPQIIERRQESYDYNCHGLTFLLRRAWFDEDDPKSFKTVFEDDGYKEIELKDALPGDIVVYYKSGNGSVDQTGSIDHTGIIVDNTMEGSIRCPWVISKWGTGAEYIHRYNNCAYETRYVKFYREGSDDI